MQLYTLLRGRSKLRLKPIMIDELKKVDNYHKALIGSDKGCGKTWHYDILESEKDAKVWKKNTTNKWTGYNDSGPLKVK